MCSSIVKLGRWVYPSWQGRGVRADWPMTFWTQHSCMTTQSDSSDGWERETAALGETPSPHSICHEKLGVLREFGRGSMCEELLWMNKLAGHFQKSLVSWQCCQDLGTGGAGRAPAAFGRSVCFQRTQTVAPVAAGYCFL